MMNRYSTDIQDSVQECVPSPPLPADHVLNSGAVLFPGAFDQHGCHLIVFPVDGQARLSSELSKAEVVDFINYFLRLHNKKQEKESLVSVVADLREASLPTTKFIAETLLLLEEHRRIVHSVYIIQPKKKALLKLLQKPLAPSASFKRVFLKEISDLSNYIDRSQLTASLGGYFVYCHQSWVAFIKEIDAFVQDFLSVVQRLPSCISTLQALSRLPLPTTSSELQTFCSTNEAKFLHLRRQLGLDELLRHCESVVKKLRHPEMEPCYQAMAGTALFTNTAFDMLQNYSRITAAVEKVELLWQQAFSKARLQLRVLQLREDALQVTERIETLLQEKLQPYKMEVAKDAAKAVMLVSQFEGSIYTPALALVRCAEDVIHTLAEILQFDSQSREHWVLDLERLKEKLHSAVHFILQTLRAVCSYHQYYKKANRWYTQVLRENLLQELLSGVNADRVPTQQQKRNWGSIPAWRHKLSTFLKNNPPPSMEELLHLDHLANVIPDDEVQKAGKQMSQRCMTLRKLLMSSGPVAVGRLQLALQWQYELLRSSHVNQTSANDGVHTTAKDLQDSPLDSSLNKCELSKEVARVPETSPSTALPGMMSADGKPPSLSSFDSGFDGAGSNQLEAWGGREGVDVLTRSAGNSDSVKPVISQPLIHEETIASISDSEDPTEVFDFGSVGNSSRASIQIIPKVTVESLNLEIKVKRSAALPNNPWLGLPMDNLENSYMVTITQNPTPQKRDPKFQEPSDTHNNTNNTHRPQDHSDPTETEVMSCTQSRASHSRDWMLHSESNLDDSSLSPIGNILSSTITDERDNSVCTTEGVPTFLWDSYDLHHQNTLDGAIDLSLKDWDVKEQEDLREVEKILDRADEILEEEENVLAQEAVLEALLKSEHRHSQWPLCYTEDQTGMMSSSELTEAGVLGLEDSLETAKSDTLSEHTIAGFVSETKALEANTVATYNRPDLLTELREIHALDELIVKENLKVHELRCHQENSNAELSGSKPLDTNELSHVSKEREAFRLKIEKEKREVEKLEKSLDKEGSRKGRARKVVRCSIMEKVRAENKEDQALCDALLSHSSQRTYSASKDACKAENIKDKLGPDKEATPENHVPQCQGLTGSEADQINSTPNLKEAPEEVGIQPQGCIYERELAVSEDATICKPEASLTPEMRPDDGAFDPGGKPIHMPEPRKVSLPLNDDLAEHETPHSTELLDAGLLSVSQDLDFVQLDLQNKAPDFPSENVTPAVNNVILNPNVKEHSNNNNNNHPEEGRLLLDHLSETAAKDEAHTSVVPASLPHSDIHPTVEMETLSHTDKPPHEHSAPQQPLEFDPSGRNELNGGLSDAVQSFESMRVSGSGSPGIQAQLNINTREVSHFKTPVILDTGSGLMKAGFANQDLPNVIFPTIIGMPKYEEIINGNLERESYIGHEAQHMRGVLILKHPIKNGIIRNWDDMEKIWHHTFQQLRVDPEDHPILLTEAAMNPLENRQRMVEIMFECFNVPFTYVAMQAVLALYTAGKTTGVVFDSGDGVSHSVPVFEGYCLPHAVQRFPLAGADVTMQLTKLLQEQGVCMRTTAEMEIAREMKEKCCCVALDYEAELTEGVSSCREMHYTMPDGHIVTLNTERFRAPEILFKPELIGRDHDGMHKSVFKSILSSDIDLRRTFLGNIVLSGGNTLLAGLPERLQAEVQGLLPAHTVESVRVTSPADRDFSVWSGGAVLASLPTFSSAWISQGEYEEYGPQIVFRKCF